MSYQQTIAIMEKIGGGSCGAHSNGGRRRRRVWATNRPLEVAQIGRFADARQFASYVMGNALSAEPGVIPAKVTTTLSSDSARH